MRIGVTVFLAALVSVLSACGSTKPKLAAPPTIAQFVVQSKLLGRQMYEELVTPAGGGEGRPLLVFLHGYGGAPSDIASPAFITALRRLGDRAPVVLLPEGDTGWWHDRDEGPWGSYVLLDLSTKYLSQFRIGSNVLATKSLVLQTRLRWNMLRS